MVEMDVVYEGQLHCQATHGPSGAVITTDAPTDNMGRGAAFSPTDLVGVALGSCVLTIMGIYAQRHKVDLAGTRAHVVKEMAAAPERRIGKLVCTVTIAKPVPPEHRQPLENAAHACPVKKSLHPEVAVELKFIYE